MTTTAPTTDAHAAALDYAARGWRVVPIAPGAKHPVGVGRWQDAATTDPETIEAWWTGEHRRAGVGIATGPGSGLFVLDVDVADGKAGDDTLAALESAHGDLPPTYEVLTGTGGRHLYFAWPDGIDVRNDQSGRLGPGLDVRGDGGQVLAPPTIHPNGTPYTVELGAPDEVADAPGWLLDILRPVEPTPTPTPTPRAVDAGDRPGDHWAATTSWSDILTPDGWTHHHTDRDGTEHWTRPGKGRREGTSATVGYKGSDVLKVFTSSMAGSGLATDATYTKVGYLAATRFGGDHSATASWLRSQGHGGERPRLADVTLAPRPPAGVDPETGEVVEREPWPEPRELPAPPEPPPFPLESLPGWTREHVENVADDLQVPVDLPAMLAVGGLAAAATGRVRVEVSARWSEPMALYLVAALRSGAGKSPAAAKTIGWLRTWERDRIATAMPAYEDAKHRAKILAGRAEKDRKGAEVGSVTVEEALVSRRLAIDAAREADDLLPRLIVDDATPQAVVRLLGVHGERLAIISTEADLFDMLLRGKPGQRADMNIYLKAFSGDAHIADRKGGTETGPELTDLAQPLLSVVTTVQPKVLDRLHADEESASRGFTARFMFSVPVDLIGHRDQTKRFAAGTIPTQDDYDRRATALAREWASWTITPTTRFHPDAAAELEDFLVSIEPRLRPDGDLAALAEWCQKMYASVARYAALLHLAEGHSPSAPVAVDSVRRAIALGRYWLETAVAVLVDHGRQTAAQADHVLAKIAAEGVGRITFHDIHMASRSRSLDLMRAADLVAPVALLIDLGYLRPVDNVDWTADIGIKGGRSPEFAVLPRVVGRPRLARVPRANHTARMGERVLSLSPGSPPTHPPRARGVISARYSEGEGEPVDNQGPPDDPPIPADDWPEDPWAPAPEEAP